MYQPYSTLTLDVRLENETVWLNRVQITTLFDRDIKTIGKHINNALKEELKGLFVVVNFATTATDGKTYQLEYYNDETLYHIGASIKDLGKKLFAFSRMDMSPSTILGHI